MSFGNGRRKKSPSSLPRGTRKCAVTGPSSVAQSTPLKPGTASGAGPPAGGGAHALFVQSRPAKHSPFAAQAPPTSFVPSGWHWAPKPTTLHRNVDLQSASDPHE